MTKRLQALGVVEARLVSANRWLVIALMAAMAVLVFANWCRAISSTRSSARALVGISSARALGSQFAPLDVLRA